MSTNTTRLGLTKPSGSASPAEAVDVGVINTNMDLIDQWAGCILVNDGVTPATGSLFDGAIVKERTSGIIWEARKNGGGTFDKVYIRYPFVIDAHYNAGAFSTSSNTTPTAANLDAVTSANCKNADASNLSGGKFVVPIKGIYSVRLRAEWAANVTGARSLSLEFNGTIFTNRYERIVPASAYFGTQSEVIFTRLCTVGDTIRGAYWQNSGGALDIDFIGMIATLIEPVQ